MGASASANQTTAHQRQRRWRGLVLAFAVSLALHLVMLAIPRNPDPLPPPESFLELTLETSPPATPSPPVDRPEPAPAKPPDNALAAEPNAEPIPQPPPDPPPVEQPGPAAEPTPAPAVMAPEILVTERQNPAEPPDRPTPMRALPDRATAPEAMESVDDAELVTRLLAAPLERDPVPGPFDLPEQAEPVYEGFRYPERENLMTMLTPALPDLPFADPGLDIFMYAPGWQGDFHRGFDQITPEFGWRSKTGFMVRCRWVIVVIGCGWGRKGFSPALHRAQQEEKEKRRNGELEFEESRSPAP